MPDFCAAYGCSNERSVATRSHGITFHRFPKDSSLKRQWERAVKRKGFVASKRSLLCSEHFNADDFDSTGQTVRLKQGVVPSVFDFSHLQKEASSRSKKLLTKAVESLPVDLPQHSHEAESQAHVETSSRSKKTQKKAEDSLPVDLAQHSHEAEPQVHIDHNYALPASPTAVKARLIEALARVESLEEEKRNHMIQEQRAVKSVRALVEHLREKNLISEELKESLECYSDLQVHLLVKTLLEYSRDHREFPSHYMIQRHPLP